MSLILRETELVNELKLVLSPDDFQDDKIAQVFSLICDLISQGKAVEAPRLIGYLNDRDSASLVSELLTIDDGFPQKDTQEILNDCIIRIKKQRLNSKCQTLQRQIKIAQQQGNQEQLDRLVAEFRDLQRLRFP